MRRLLVVLPLVAALAGCGANDDDDAAGGTVPTVSDTDDTSSSGPSATTPPPSTPPPSTTPPSFSVKTTPLSPRSTPVPASIPGTPIDPTMPLVVAAVEDLAGRLGIEPEEVTVVAARAVTWPDGSLGCPQPGMMYTQVLVDGVLVVLEAGGRHYEYHGGDPLFLCETPKPPSGG